MTAVRVAFYGRSACVTHNEVSAARAAQRVAASRLAEHCGVEIVAEYFDANVSGTRPFGERPEGRRLLEELRSLDGRRFDGVIAAELSRLVRGGGHRRPGSSPELLAELSRLDARVYLPEFGGEVNPDDPTHDMMFRLIRVAAEPERDRTI